MFKRCFSLFERQVDACQTAVEEGLIGARRGLCKRFREPRMGAPIIPGISKTEGDPLANKPWCSDQQKGYWNEDDETQRQAVKEIGHKERPRGCPKGRVRRKSPHGFGRSAVAESGAQGADEREEGAEQIG